MSTTHILTAHSSILDGHELTTLEMDGRRCWLLSEVETVLGYRPGVLSQMVSGRWAGDFLEGVEIARVEGERLAALKAALPGAVPPSSWRAVLLYDAGVATVVMHSQKPEARALWRHLTREVLPALSAPHPVALSDRDRVALTVGRELLSASDRTRAAGATRIATLARAANALLGGCTSDAEVAGHAHMRTSNAQWALWELARLGVARAEGDVRHAATAKWSIAPPAEPARQIAGPGTLRPTPPDTVGQAGSARL